MICPQCSTDNLEGTSRCSKCTTPLPLSDMTQTGGVAGGWSAQGAGGPSGWSVARPGDSYSAPTPPLEAGTVMGNRYEVMSLLGEGGMGAVYKVRARELDRLVALKIIRRDLAQNSDVLHRFKQELILARKVTHRNVIRIFDLGEADGVKFITMEHIDGETLKTILLREGKVTPLAASNIIRKVCRGL